MRLCSRRRIRLSLLRVYKIDVICRLVFRSGEEITPYEPPKEFKKRNVSNNTDPSVQSIGATILILPYNQSEHFLKGDRLHEET